MRKDAKIGFAIGGVLLAVIVVYLLVVPRHSRVANRQGVTLVTPSASTTSQPPAVAPTPVGESNTPAPVSNDNTTGSAGMAPIVSSMPTASSGAADMNKPTTAPAPSAVASAAPANPGVSGDGANWEKLFAGSTQLPSASPAVSPTDNRGPIAGATPAVGSAVALRNNSSAGAALDGGATTVANADRGTAGASKLYVIEQGQTLSSIAATVYGNSRYYVAILKANPTINPNRLRPGMRIALPDVSDIKPSRSTASEGGEAIAGANEPRSLDAGGAAGGGVINASEAAMPTEAQLASDRVYAVQKGDTLYGIAKRLYGKASEANAIYNMNQEAIGPNRGKLKLGMVLHLPAAADSGT